MLMERRTETRAGRDATTTPTQSHIVNSPLPVAELTRRRQASAAATAGRPAARPEQGCSRASQLSLWMAGRPEQEGTWHGVASAPTRVSLRSPPTSEMRGASRSISPPQVLKITFFFYKSGGTWHAIINHTGCPLVTYHTSAQTRPNPSAGATKRPDPAEAATRQPALTPLT